VNSAVKSRKKKLHGEENSRGVSPGNHYQPDGGKLPTSSPCSGDICHVLAGTHFTFSLGAKFYFKSGINYPTAQRHEVTRVSCKVP
jgi:hypothetical protein